MDSRIINIDIWKEQNIDKEHKIYVTKTRMYGYVKLYFIDKGYSKAYLLDFRNGALELLDEANDNLAEMLEIDEITAHSLIKEVLDIKLAGDMRLEAKEAVLYDRATYVLLDHGKGIERLAVRSNDAEKTLEAVKNMFIYGDYGLLYELAGEKICPKEMSKHIFIHNCRESGKNVKILPETLYFMPLVAKVNELGEEVLAGCAVGEYQTNDFMWCRMVVYFELLPESDGYVLNRHLTLENSRLYGREEYSFRYYLRRYEVADGRWLAGALLNDERLLLIGEKDYYQLYTFLQGKVNSPAKLMLLAGNVVLYADSEEKLDKLVGYLAENLICEMDDLLCEKKMVTALELAEIFLQSDCR